MLEIMLSIALGILTGTITGLMPGLHMNLVSALLVSVSPILLGQISTAALACFIVSMGTAQTFLDAVPAIFLGAPEPGTALNVLPGHRLLVMGRGYDAVRLSLAGSLVALIITIILIPLMIPVIKTTYPLIRDSMSLILSGVLVFMVVKEKENNRKFWAFVFICISGILGLIVLNMPNLEEPLFPMLSGIFGIPVLLLAVRERTAIAEQLTEETITVPFMEQAKAVVAAVFSGGITATLPGVGAATAALIATELFRSSIYTFMIILGGVATVNFVFSLATLFAIGKARNGAIAALLDITNGLGRGYLLLLIGCALIAGGAATIIGLFVARRFSGIIARVDYERMCIAIVFTITAMAFVLSGALGLFVLAVSTALGLSINLIGVKRSTGMACLIVPVIVYFAV